MYKVEHEVKQPDYTKNSWLSSRLLNNGLNLVSEQREIAAFSINEIIGFEEILSRRMLEKSYFKNPLKESKGGKSPKLSLKLRKLFSESSL